MPPPRPCCGAALQRGGRYGVNALMTLSHIVRSPRAAPKADIRRKFCPVLPPPSTIWKFGEICRDTTSSFLTPEPRARGVLRTKG